MSAVQQMLLACGGGAGAACDPYFAYVGLLLHFDGVNGGTTFVDSSNNAYTPTLLGSTTPTTSTTQIKFGTASGYFFASSQSALQYASVSPLDIYSTGASFTVETWVYPLSNNNRAIVGSWEGNFSGDRYLLCLVGGVLYINWDGGTLMSGGSVPNNVWTHIALVRNGNVFTAYVNGISVATTTYSVAPTRGWWYTQVGVYASNNWGFDGYMDELRITKGIARYTANFTPQSAAFPDNACALTPHLYWRVKNPDAGYYGTLELELRTVATGNTTISATNTGGTPISGGYYNRSGSDLNPGNAFNGTFAAPRFSSDAIVNGGDAWVGYQFPSAVIIREVALAGSGVSGQDFGGAVTVDWSDDGVSWTTAKVLSVSGLSSSAFVCYSVP